MEASEALQSCARYEATADETNAEIAVAVLKDLSGCVDAIPADARRSPTLELTLKRPVAGRTLTSNLRVLSQGNSFAGGTDYEVPSIVGLGLKDAADVAKTYGTRISGASGPSRSGYVATQRPTEGPTVGPVPKTIRVTMKR